MSSAVEPMDPSGLVLGRYRPLRPLGSGGSGTVWLARDETSGLEVALKIIAKEGRAGPRAEREAEAATRLRHPHCLRAYGLESDDKHLYIPYEYVPGSTLRQALRTGELGDDGAVEAAAQVLEGLAFAHARGIVHRDVKPSNVLVTDEEHVSVRLFDFGLAQLADAETLTAAGDVPGTLAYISPERLLGETAGPPADVWAVGVLLWEALAGHHPFWRASPLETGEVIKAGAPSIGEARPDLPEPLVAAVDAALSVDPAQRPSAARLSKALRAAWLERMPNRARPKPKARIRIDPKRVLARGAAPALAALAVGWTAAALPFYPASWPLLLAAVAAALTVARARLGLAFALAVPLFPLGNVSLGLAFAYAGLAVAWLALMWGDPRRGLLFGSGIVLGPIGLLGLVPLVVMHVRSTVRRDRARAGCGAPGRRRRGRPRVGDPVQRLGPGLSGRGRKRAPDRGSRSSLAMASGQPCAGSRGADPCRCCRCAPPRDAQGRPLDRHFRGRAARGDAARGPAGRGGGTGLHRLAHVPRSHGPVAAAARSRRCATPFRCISDTDTRASPG